MDSKGMKINHFLENMMKVVNTKCVNILKKILNPGNFESQWGIKRY